MSISPNIHIGTTVRIEFTTDEGSDYHVGEFMGTDDAGDYMIFTRIAGELAVNSVSPDAVDYLDVA